MHLSAKKVDLALYVLFKPPHPSRYLSSQQVKAQINMAWFLGQHSYPLQTRIQVWLHSGMKH